MKTKGDIVDLAFIKHILAQALWCMEEFSRYSLLKYRQELIEEIIDNYDNWELDDICDFIGSKEIKI